MRLQGFRGLVEDGGVLRTDICLVKVEMDATQDDLSPAAAEVVVAAAVAAEEAVAVEEVAAAR